jgi:maltose alpha-D-glucosyltransferase/alpha-amylase
LIARRQSVRLPSGEMTALPGRMLLNRREDLPVASSQVLRGEQSNTSILYGGELFLKLYRRLDEGVNPDVEVSRVLTEQGKFPNVPRVVGSLELRVQGAEPIALAMVQEFVRNQGDAWSIMLDEARSYLERVLTVLPGHGDRPAGPVRLLDAAEAEPDILLQELIGGVALERALLLGQRTGELHLALAKVHDPSNFAPEPFSLLYQRSLYHGMRTQIRRSLEFLRKQARTLPADLRSKAHRVVDLERDILGQLSALFGKKIPATKIRIHGDYHLGQVLFTGNDFLIIDFEGEPAKTIGERQLRRSPLRDVAGMIRSFHYPAYATLFTTKAIPEDAVPALMPWAERWYTWMSGTFLKAYLKTTEGASFVPRARDEMELLLSAYLLEKAAYELTYELNNRPEWVIIPIHGILQLMEAHDDNTQN